MEQEPKQAGAKEQAPLTDDQARQLLADGKDKEFLAWMTQEQKRAKERASESDKSPLFELDIRLGIIYWRAGDKDTALRMIKEANAAVQQELKKVYEHPDKKEYTKKLKEILQSAIYLEQELRR